MKTIEVVAAIIRDGDRIFATQRGYGDWKDYWEFPGGKIEPGEGPEEALVREIREELGAEIAVESYLTTIEYDYPAFRLSMGCYLARVTEGELTLREHEAARWLSKDELDSVAWLPADRTILGLLKTELQLRRTSEMNYKVIDKESYYRKGVFRHFSEDCKCSASMTARVDVTELVARSRRTGTRFYLNFLYLLSKVLNAREDYRMGYLWQTDELICYDVIHPTQYVFHEDTETCTPVYTEYHADYETFYAAALRDLEEAKKTREYKLDPANHPNWFDASFIPWLSYDALHIELPDGYLYFAPIVNWGRYREENGRLLMPVSVRMNHAVADGYLIAKVFRLLEQEIAAFSST